MALFLPQKIAGPIFRIEQDLLLVTEGDLTKTVHLRSGDILTELSESINTAVRNVGNIVQDAQESGKILEMKIIEGDTGEIKKAFELHKKHLECIKTKP